MKSLEETYTTIDTIIKASQSHLKLIGNLDVRFGDTLDTNAEEAELTSRSNLGLWIGILEQAIQWLSRFHDVLGNAASTGRSELVIVPYAVIGTCISQASAIRKLCLVGLDTPARSILRTLIESLNMALLTIFDPEAERDFLNTDDEKKARIFWNKYIRKSLDKETGKRQSRVNNVLEQTLAMTGHDEEHIETVIKHYENLTNMTSRTVHISLHAAMFTTKLLSSDAKSLLAGKFGSSSLFSVLTLSQASKWIWQFSRIVHPLLIIPLQEGTESLYDLDLSTDEAKDEYVAYTSLNALIVAHWNDDNVELNHGQSRV